MLDLAASFDVNGDDWRFDLDPHPTSEWSNWTIGGVRRWEDRYQQPLDLDRFGILPGSVLTMTCPHRSLGSTTDTYSIWPSHLS